MADDPRTPATPFLRRWSQRKLAAARETDTAVPDTRPLAVPPAAASTVPAAPMPALAAAVPELPPVDSLSFDSDFTAFLAEGVDPAVKRAALKKLFADPRFNVMDGLDVYIDDYTKFEPIPPEVMAKLNQARYLFNPPKTRVNNQGQVEDVPDEPAPADTETEAGDPAGTQARTDGAAVTPDTKIDDAPRPAGARMAESEKSQ